MKFASNTARVTPPEAPPNGVAGLDWACDDHAVSVVDARRREAVRHQR